MGEHEAELEATARELVAHGKGILAADESNRTMTKRLEAVGVDSNEESRHSFRELLFTTDGASEFVSGVILYDETIRQQIDGTPIPDYLSSIGIVPGIKVDTGTQPLAGSSEEKVTEGLDGLGDRLEEYRTMGARFAKWRAVIGIDDLLPSTYCIHVNAHALGRYAALCQQAGLVPIVEPEVLMDGSHTLERAFEVTEATLRTVFSELFAQRVAPEGMLLKPNMVLAGYERDDQPEVDEVARATLSCLSRVVPAAVPGIVFLSGGQSDELATAHLQAMNAIGGVPWELSFSYGRALQAQALELWGGEQSDREAARAAYRHRARCNAAARRGAYEPGMEQEPAAYEPSHAVGR